jgi:hypothetical protein
VEPFSLAVEWVEPFSLAVEWVDALLNKKSDIYSEALAARAVHVTSFQSQWVD